MNLWAFLLPLFICICVSTELYAENACTQLLRSDLSDTLNGFELMRGESGLIQDTIWISQKKQDIKIKILNSDTSLTNIAVDLLIQAETKNLKNLRLVIDRLSRLSFHRHSGLFFSWYKTDMSLGVQNFDVSAIDNLHLALALWTIGENFKEQDFGKTAHHLFERMDFSVFLEESTQLVGGNLRFDGKTWIREAYNFSYWGSEARLFYSLGWALDLFKSAPKDKPFYLTSFQHIHFETLETKDGPVLKLWDGALFQIYFPKIFINEELYSKWMSAFYKNTSSLIIAEGKRRGLNLPAAHSAGRASYRDRSNKGLQPSYKDKSGLKILVSESNKDLNNPNLGGSWESLFTSYSLFMAATNQTVIFKDFIEYARTIRQRGIPLYLSGHGWMDALDLKDHGKRRVIPAQLALNQGMIALSLFQMAHPAGLSLSSETLFKNPHVKEKLKQFYQDLDQIFE